MYINKYGKISNILIMFMIIVLVISIQIYCIEAFSGDTLQILHLVLYSTDNGGAYDRMKKTTSKYYKKYPNIKTIYYRFSPELHNDDKYLLNGDELLISGNESYSPGILQKTISAFEYFKDELDQYSYIVRSNISTIIRFDLLSKDLENKSVDYGCALCFYGERPFSSGTSIILSPKMVENLINNKTDIVYDTIDDVEIGNFISKFHTDVSMKPVLTSLANNGFYFTPNMNSDQEKINEYILQNEIVFYRNRNDDDDRVLDANQMEIIINNIIQ